MCWFYRIFFVVIVVIAVLKGKIHLGCVSLCLKKFFFFFLLHSSFVRVFSKGSALGEEGGKFYNVR